MGAWHFVKKWGQIALCLYFLRGMNVRKREISLEKGGEKGQGTAGGRALGGDRKYYTSSFRNLRF